MGTERVTRKRQRPASIYLLLAGLLFQGLSGVGGGVMLVIDPSGRTLQIPLQWLDGSPFDDYLVPGLVLLLVLGLFPLFVLRGVWRQLPWAWLASLVVGFGLVVWIGVEILIIGYHSQPPLQLIYGSLGVVLLLLVLQPSTRRFLRRQAQGAA